MSVKVHGYYRFYNNIIHLFNELMIFTKGHWILIINVLVLTLGLESDGKCPEPRSEQLNQNQPFFTRDMYESSVMSVSMIGYVHCCIYGVSNINWWFKNSDSKHFTQIIKGKDYQLENNNRKLIVLNVSKNSKGIYKCVGNNEKGNSLSNQTFVIVVQSTYNKDIEIVDASDITELTFVPYSNYTFYCLVKVFPGSICNFSWNRKKNGKRTSILAHSNLTKKRTYDTLVEGYSGYSQLKELNKQGNFRNFLFELIIFNIQTSHEGEYSCLVEDRFEKDERVFNVYVKLLGKEHIYIASGIVGCFILIFILAYEFQYDCKILLKKSLQFLTIKEKNFGSYNFFFLYDFDDEYTFQTIAKVVKKIESRYCTVYFYHRDQIYGKIMFEELYEKLQRSDVIVFWVSQKIWKNPISSFCIQMLIRNYPKKTRLYIMTSNKQNAMENCNSSMISADIKSWILSNIYFWNIKKSKFSKLWRWHNLSSWLISSLPVHSLPLR